MDPKALVPILKQPQAPDEATIETLMHELGASWAQLSTSPESIGSEAAALAKTRAVADFFSYCKKLPPAVRPADILGWQNHLRNHVGLADSTIYATVSKISAFFDWLLQEEALAELIPFNPVLLARPRPPRAYGSATPLTDSDLRLLLKTVQERADSGDVVGKRDYALLLFYVLTGLNKSAILGLRWRHVVITDEEIVIQVRAHSGHQRIRKIANPHLRIALLDYLVTSERLPAMEDEHALWVRHDRAGGVPDPESTLTATSLDKIIQRHAKQAGLPHMHIHQIRHTYARIADQELENVNDVRTILGHHSDRMTRALLEHVRIEPDPLSAQIARRILAARTEEDEA